MVILLGAFVWIRLLHRQVELRTQELRREITEHEKTEELLARKTRLLQREVEEHKKTEAKKPQVDEKAYNEALKRIPEPKEKYDPWSGARPDKPAK